MSIRLFLAIVLVIAASSKSWAAGAVTIGPALSFRDGREWRWFGEASALQIWDKVGLGAVVGSSTRIHYVEIEPFYFDDTHARGVVFGINPGLVIDRSSPPTRTGFQATAWIWPRIVFGDAGIAPLPLAYLRSESYAVVGTIWSIGLMLKIPVWVR